MFDDFIDKDSELIGDDVEVIDMTGEDIFEEDDDDDNSIAEEAVITAADLAKLTFEKHKKSVFACDVSVDTRLAVTGGEDDVAYLWSTDTGDVTFECTGHKDSVTQVRFSRDSKLVATGDMGGMIQVWHVPDGKLIWCYEGDDVEWLAWHPLADVLIAGTQSGDVYVWQIPQGACKVLSGHGAICTCGRVLPDGKRLVAGYTDGQIKLWDIKSASVVWQSGDRLSGGVNALDMSADGTVMCVAPGAELIKIADGKVVSKFMLTGETEVEAILFINELGVLVTGSLSGQLCVWDLSRQSIRHQARIECAVTVLVKGPHGTFFVGATDGAIYVCDAKTGQLLETLTGHRSDILSLTVPLLADDNNKEVATTGFVLSTSDDGTAKIFNFKS